MEHKLAELRRQIQERDEQINRMALESQGAALAVQTAQAEAAAALEAVHIRDIEITQLQTQVNEAHTEQSSNQIVNEIRRALNGAHQTPIERILKQLQTPAIIRDIPAFDGDTDKVFNFCQAIDNVLEIAKDAVGTPAYSGWLTTIRNKIIGDANRILSLYTTSTDWNEIRQILITHYSDKRDEVALSRDLYKLYQNGSVQDFYKDVCRIISHLTNRLNLNETNEEIKAAKLKLYQEMGLKVFVGGLREPLGPVIRAQLPDTLREALRLCHEESNFNQSMTTFPRNIPRHLPPKPTPPRIQTQHYQPSYQPTYHPPTYKPIQQPSYPSTYKPAYPNPNITRPPFMSKKQMFMPANRPIPQYKPTYNTNPFRQNYPNHSNIPTFQQKPVPMEVDPSIRVNYMNRPNFHMETNPECYQNDPHYYPEYYQENYEQCEENVDNPEELETTSTPAECSLVEKQNIDDLNFQISWDLNQIT